MVADAVGVLIGEAGAFAGHAGDHFDAFEQACGVVLAAAQVVNLAGAGGLGEMPEGVDHIMAVNLIADLFSLVAEDGVGAFVKGDVNQIVEEAVKLDAGMLRAGEASAAKHAGLEAKVAAI